MNNNSYSSRGDNGHGQRNITRPIDNRLQAPLRNRNSDKPPDQIADALNCGEEENRRVSATTVTNAGSIDEQNAASNEQGIPPGFSKNKFQGAIPKYVGRELLNQPEHNQDNQSLTTTSRTIALNNPTTMNSGDQASGYARQPLEDWPTPSLRPFFCYGGGPANRGVSEDVRQRYPDMPRPKYVGRKSLPANLADYRSPENIRPNWAKIEKAVDKPTQQHFSGNEVVYRQSGNQSQGAIPKANNQKFTDNAFSGNAQESNFQTPSANQSQETTSRKTQETSDGGAQVDHGASGDAQQNLVDRRDKPSGIPSREVISKYSYTRRGNVDCQTTALSQPRNTLNPNAAEFKLASLDLEAELEEDWQDGAKVHPTIAYEFEELKMFLKKLDQKGIIKCNVVLPDSIKVTKITARTHGFGLANLIPSKADLLAILDKKSIQVFKPFAIQDNTSRQIMELFDRKCVPMIVQQIHDPEYYTEEVYNSINNLMKKLGVTHQHPKFIQFFKIMNHFLNAAKSLFRECLRGEINHIILNDWANNNQLVEEYNKKSTLQTIINQNTFLTDQYGDDRTRWFYDQVEVKVCVNTRRDLFGEEPCFMFTDLSNPFPLCVSVNSRGNILYQFKFGVFVELTRHMGIRLSCPEAGIFIAVSAFGTNFSVLHPQGRAFKRKGALQLQSFNKGVYRYARITKDQQLLLTKSTSDIIFELTDNELETTNRQKNVQCLTTDDTVDVLQSEGVYGPDTAYDCMVLAYNAKYEHAVKNDNIILGSIKIVQMPNGNLSVFRDNKYLHMQIMPSVGVCQMYTPDYKIRADINNKAVSFLVKKDFNRILIHQNKFIIRRHDLSAGFDELNYLKNSFLYPKYEG